MPKSQTTARTRIITKHNYSLLSSPKLHNLMHGSQGIMVDSLLNPRAEPKGEVWLSAIILMAAMHQQIYISLLIG